MREREWGYKSKGERKDIQERSWLGKEHIDSFRTLTAELKFSVSGSMAPKSN